MKTKLERSIERWAGMVPTEVIKGSLAQTLFCIEDAQKDIATLAAEVNQLEPRLKRQTAPSDKLVAKEYKIKVCGPKQVEVHADGLKVAAFWNTPDALKWIEQQRKAGL